MKFQIEKQDLLKILSDINGAVEKKNTIPILSNVKLDITDNLLSVVGTDMDIFVTSTTQVKDATNGSTTISAQLFFDIVKKIPDDKLINVVLNEDNTILAINYDNSEFKLPCIDVSQFPEISQTDMSTNFTINAINLAQMIDRTKFAIASDETRHYLNGIFMHSHEHSGEIQLRFVATDGHRMSMAINSKIENLQDVIDGVIIPKKTISELRRIISGKNDNVEVELSKSKIKFQIGNAIIISKLIDGQFPEYEKVIPKNNDKSINVNKKTLFDAVDRVATIANDRHKSIKFVVGDEKISLNVKTNDGSFANEEIPVNYNDQSVEIGFNSRYLLEIINNSSEDELNIKFQGSMVPVIISGKEDTGLYVIMPIRI